MDCLHASLCISIVFDSQVGVVGLGLMGHGITQVAAERGYAVTAIEVNDEAIANGMKMIDGSLAQSTKRMIKSGKMEEGAAAAWVDSVKQNISTSTDVGSVSDCDIVIEAATENPELKKTLFRNISGAAREDAIIATNTSSLLLKDLDESVTDPTRFVGLHFFNPVQMM